MNKKNEIIILGGGQASAYAAKEIRSIDKESKITLITEEKNLPYERPPLSKECLLGNRSYSQCLFFDKDFYQNENIEIIQNEKIIKTKLQEKKLYSNSNTYSFDQLLISTGSINRKLILKSDSSEILKEILYLRNVNDCEKIKNRLIQAKKILIIGGGFIGLEIASVASQKGKQVHIVEMVKTLMGRVIPEQISKIVQQTHESYGCKFYLSENIKNITKNNNIYEAELESKKKIKADLIIVGVGSIPNTEIFQDSELQIDNGILTNEYCQTSIEDVYAAGDVANFFHPFYNFNMRLESFKHAQNHGINAGKNIAGLKTSYQDIPWMWSDQYNLNLQLTGICNDYETYAQRGNSVEEGIIYFFLKNRYIIGACGVGVGGKIGRDIRLAGKLSEAKIKLTKETLSDRNIKLNALLKKL